MDGRGDGDDYEEGTMVMVTITNLRMMTWFRCGASHPTGHHAMYAHHGGVEGTPQSGVPEDHDCGVGGSCTSSQSTTPSGRDLAAARNDTGDDGASE